MIHELKILPRYFNAVLDMTKPFEVRSEKDRLFNVRDELLLKEFVPKDYYEPGEEVCPNCGSKDIRPYKGHFCCYECSEFFE